MKIGVNCYLLQADIGGIRQYFLNLFDALLINDDANEYIFFYFDHNVEDLNRLRSSKWRNNSILLEAPKDIKQHLDKIDLYFCPFSTLSPRPLPMPTVYMVPDIQEVFYPHFFSNYLIVARTYHYLGSSKMADAIITISDFSKKSLLQFHRIPAEKVTVAHLCIDEKFYRAQETMRCPDQTLPDKYIFFPANYWIHKNHDLLLRALAWLKKEKKVKVNLVLTGFGKDDGYPLSIKLEYYGLLEQVYQLGYVSVEELVYIYKHAQLLVFPSLFEGFGIPLVEAMATGCPILAARSTSLPEIGGDAARYFDSSSPENLGDAIFELLHDKELRAGLVEKGFERVKHFSSEQLAQKHLRAFKQAAASFSMRKYIWYRFVYKYYHAARMLLMPEFYGMLYDLAGEKLNKMRKVRKLKSAIAGLKNNYTNWRRS